MEVYYKVQNPKTGKMIDMYGATFNKLLTQGYTEQQLLSTKYATSQKPKSPKVQQVYKEKQKYLESLVLPEEIIFEEIIMQMKEPDFMSICKANKSFNKLCSNDHFWHKMYNKYYGDSGMKELLKDLDYLGLFKICYNLYFIQKISGNISIKQLYEAKQITASGEVSTKIFTAVSYMYNLTEITFNIKDFTKPIIIPSAINALPFLLKITYNKI